MVGTRATQDTGDEEGDDYEPSREITDPTSKLQKQKRLIKTPKQLDIWMTEARPLLLKYLEFCRQKAQAQSVADKIEKCNQKLDNDWRTTWASKTDVQTGEIYGRAMQADMIEAMKIEATKRSQYHKSNDTAQWHIRYQEAQSYWEDFLYYQNQPRYKMKEVKSLVRTFVWKGNDAGEEGFGENKQFLGHYIDTIRHEKHFVLDRDGHRIEEDKRLHPIKLPGPAKYEVPSLPNKWNRLQGPGRRDRAWLRVLDGTSKDWHKSRATPDDTRDAEFSDDEHTDANASNDEPDIDLEGLEDDSDDEWDLFTLSYQGLPLLEVNPDHRPRHNTPAPDDESGDGETGSDKDSDNDNDNHDDSGKVPAFKADVEPAPRKNPPRKVYPANGSIPAVKHKSTAWKSNPTYAPREDNKFEGINGRWDNGDHHWIPTVIVRSFRLDNNGYFGFSINPCFDAIMKGDKVSHEVLQKRYIKDFNKGFNQVYRRSDHDFDDWKTGDLKRVLCAMINAHRAVNGQKDQGKRARSQDSVTSKFKRYFADLLEQAENLNENIAKGKQPSEDELRPKDVLTGDATIAKKGKPPKSEPNKAKDATLPKASTHRKPNKNLRDMASVKRKGPESSPADQGASKKPKASEPPKPPKPLRKPGSKTSANGVGVRNADNSFFNDEEAWIKIYYTLLARQAVQQVEMPIPPTTDSLLLFNAYFQGFKEPIAEPTRTRRNLVDFETAVQRVCPELKTQIDGLREQRPDYVDADDASAEASSLFVTPEQIASVLEEAGKLDADGNPVMTALDNLSLPNPTPADIDLSLNSGPQMANRHEDAAYANALINACPVPPLGFFGDLRELKKQDFNGDHYGGQERKLEQAKHKEQVQIMRLGRKVHQARRLLADCKDKYGGSLDKQFSIRRIIDYLGRQDAQYIEAFYENQATEKSTVAKSVVLKTKIDMVSISTSKKIPRRMRTQYNVCRRRQRKREKPKQLRCTKEEYSVIVNHLNKVIAESGLRDFVDQVDTYTDQTIEAINKYRKGRDPNDEGRSDEAMRTKFTRCIGYQAKLEDAKRLTQRRNGMSHEALRAKKYFKLADFDAQNTKFQKTGNMKATAGDMSEGKGAEGAQNIDAEGGNAAKRGKRHGDAAGGAMQPPKKQRKLHES
ncbi:hypothetical protein E8E11_004669 [Didymella keratinophila]|nr:hypothetical protein E8E11_004669 [Didymella keratinophila]